jgi:hypothetical protein
MDYTVIHCLVLTISLIGTFFLYFALKKAPRDEFITSMIVSSLALIINIMLYSSVYLVDNLDHQLYDISIYNWWSAFIRMQNVTTITWIAVLAYNKIYHPHWKETLLSIIKTIKDWFRSKLILLSEKIRGLRK